jgi:hypothetical protein
MFLRLHKNTHLKQVEYICDLKPPTNAHKTATKAPDDLQNFTGIWKNLGNTTRV